MSGDIATVLRDAADAYLSGALAWGTEWFAIPGDETCRCALGAVAYAVDPRDPDGDPRHVREGARPLAREAVEFFANFLVEHKGAERAVNYGDLTFDAIETVGGWNDEPDRTREDVIAALDEAARRAELSDAAGTLPHDARDTRQDQK